MPNILLLTIKR